MKHVCCAVGLQRGASGCWRRHAGPPWAILGMCPRQNTKTHLLMTRTSFCAARHRVKQPCHHMEVLMAGTQMTVASRQ